jgi:hypothetical protein
VNDVHVIVNLHRHVLHVGLVERLANASFGIWTAVTAAADNARDANTHVHTTAS